MSSRALVWQQRLAGEVAPSQDSESRFMDSRVSWGGAFVAVIGYLIGSAMTAKLAYEHGEHHGYAAGFKAAEFDAKLQRAGRKRRGSR